MSFYVHLILELGLVIYYYLKNQLADSTTFISYYI